MKHEQQTWEVTPLTPLHIGDGRSLHQELDFIPAGANRVHVVEMDDLLDQLQDNVRAINEIGRMGIDLSRLIKDHRLKPTGYLLPLNGTTTPREFRSFMKNAHNQPFLPGSSLKGALRTALLVDLISASDPPKALKGSLEKVGGKDPHHDFLRVLQVSDSPGNDPSCLTLEEIKFLNLFSETRAGWKDFATRKTKDNFQEAQGSFVEAVKPDTGFVMQMNLDGFLRQEVIQKAAGLSRSNALSAMGALVQTINRHSLHLVQREKQFFTRFGTTTASVVRFYSELERFIGECRQSSFYLRMAWGSGWKGMTGDWISGDDLVKVRKENNLGKTGCPACYSGNVKWDKQSRKYVCGNHKCGASFDANEKWLFPVFPKTRRLAMKDGIPCLPLGWVKVSRVDKERFWQLALDAVREEQSSHSSSHATQPVASQPDAEEPSGAKSNSVTDGTLPTQEVKCESWNGAILTWAPNSGILTASFEGKKAFSQNKNLVPECYARTLFDKKKSVKAVIDVEVKGNQYTIVDIRARDQG